MHYGDSQLEGDRITAILRNELQKKFGGNGVGLLSIKNVSRNHLSIQNKLSKNWHRITIMNSNKSERGSAKLAINGSYCYFDDSKANIHSLGTIEIKPSSIAYPRSGIFEHMKLMYGNPEGDFFCEISVGDSILFADSLHHKVDYAVVDLCLPKACKRLAIKLSGNNRLPIYGLDLSSSRGIIVDNISLRGSYGTFFSHTDPDVDKRILADLDPELIILQFGTNKARQAKSLDELNEYTKRFGTQLDFLKLLRPNTPILVVGPGDIAQKQNGQLGTPQKLVLLNEKMRQLAFSKKCAFWDLFEAMGGENCMVSWEKGDPRLAVSDYTHFTPLGAKLVGKMLLNSILLEYEKYGCRND